MPRIVPVSCDSASVHRSNPKPRVFGNVHTGRFMQQAVLLVVTILLVAIVHNRFGTIPSLLILIGSISLLKTYYRASQRARSRKTKVLAAWLTAAEGLGAKATMTLRTELNKLTRENG